MQNDIKHIWVDLSDELFSFIVKKVKHNDIAKDIHQDVFLKIQTKIHQLNTTSKLTSWVYQITRHTIIDYFRVSQSKHIAIEDIDLPEDDSDSFNYSKLSECINQKISTLSSKHKEAIILTTFKEYSQKDLAKHLNISYSGTKSRIQKAREILKDDLLNCPNIESDSTGKITDFEKN